MVSLDPSGTRVDATTNAALSELRMRPPRGVSRGELHTFAQLNYARIWRRVADAVEPQRPHEWEMTWIGCGLTKRHGEHRAVDLYSGSLFRSQLRIALHSTGRTPQILSAKYGLLAPHERVRMYDTTLEDGDYWRRWSAGILALIRDYLRRTSKPSILVLAGARYADGWVNEARALGVTVDEPLRRLELGARRAFARELVARTPARRFSDGMAVSPRDQLMSFAAQFRQRLEDK